MIHIWFLAYSMLNSNKVKKVSHIPLFYSGTQVV